MLEMLPLPAPVSVSPKVAPVIVPVLVRFSVPASEEIVLAARSGFAAAPEEAMLGINAVAAPIFDDKDACIGTLALVGSIQFLPAQADAATVSALKATAQKISRKLGHSELHGQTRQARRKAG